MGGRWKILIIDWLAESPRHFAGLHRLMPRISQKVLTEQLRDLIADETADQEETGPLPAPVRYSLTAYGRSLIPLVDVTRRWGRGHIERFNGKDDRKPSRLG